MESELLVVFLRVWCTCASSPQIDKEEVSLRRVIGAKKDQYFLDKKMVTWVLWDLKKINLGNVGVSCQVTVCFY